MSLAKDKPCYAKPSDYDDDVYAWASEQAQLLRLGRFSELDILNVIEEIESLGSEQRHALESSYRILILHLLKWHFQSARRSRSWDSTISRERGLFLRREKRNHSLRARAQELADDVYPDAVREAAKETGLPPQLFRSTCPYSLEFLRKHDAMPEVLS
ncbi:DUF29 domain-containing protein [Aureimonas glaciei]|uniref:DUF29 domain-containing protein n=1 Tax=Aureimonas glaciei TaxID=1776957 RepID=A0A916XTP5_9HYPH|nr:DUF29 domain-containing protein [Aureimonas glaciei]GGD06517.1 hypothetical protein GCM10011335_06860 [Aureimonas glaciei]